MGHEYMMSSTFLHSIRAAFQLLKFIRWEDKLAKRRAYMDGLRPLIQVNAKAEAP
jgi:hypothetical protein